MKTIEEVRDDMLEVIEDHAAKCGDPNCCEPANFMGFLLHSAGIRADQLAETQHWLREYERLCENCSHRRN